MEYWEERVRKKWSDFKQYMLIGAVMVFGLKLNLDAVKRESVKREKEFAAKEAAYQKYIHELELKAGTFKFFEHLANGVKFEDWKAVDDQKFVNNLSYELEAFRAPELSLENIQNADSLKDPKSGKPFKKLGFEVLLNSKSDLRKEVVRAYYAGKDTLFLKKSRQFFDYSLAQMEQGSFGRKEMIAKYLEMPSDDIERRAKIVGNMIELKAKHQIYADKKAFMKDFGELAIMENITDYRSLSAGVDSILSVNYQKYRELVTRDSLAFEVRKNAQKDSLVKEANTIRMPQFKWNSFKPMTVKQSARGS